ncbi:ComEC family competence protein [Marinilabiliaceae bacterium JC017]|nr:ComEC family competence protein [Marinilabiliaceae bacterium JC017]
MTVLLKKTPLVRFVVPYLLGIFLHEYIYKSNLIYFFLVAVFLFIGWSIVVYRFFKKPSYAYRWVPGLFFFLFVFLFGITYSLFRQSHPIGGNEKVIVYGYVSQFLGESPKSLKYELYSEEVIGDSIAIKGRSHKGILYIEKDSSRSIIEPGQAVLVKGNLLPFSKPLNPQAFDYSRYLLRKGYVFRIYSRSEDSYELMNDIRNDNALGFNFFRYQLKRVFDKAGLENQELALASALFLGDRAFLEEDSIRSFSKAGVMHVLAVSGLHLGILYLLLGSLFSFMKRTVFRGILVLSILWCYAFLTGLSPSVFRAVTMFSFLEIGIWFKRKNNVYNSLVASATLILLVNPFNAYMVGFWLSHVAVASIVFFYPYFVKLWNPDFIVFRWLWSITALSVAAQLGTLPLCLYFFDVSSSYFILGNILLMPVLAPVLLLSLVILLLPPFSFVSNICVGALSDLLQYMLAITKWIENLPGAVWGNIGLNGIDLIFFSGIVLSVVVLLYTSRPYSMRLLFLCFIGLLVSRGIRKMTAMQQSQFVVFHKKGNSIVNVIAGGRNQVIASKQVTRDEIGYLAHDFWVSRFAVNPDVEYLNPVDTLPTKVTVNSHVFLLMHNKSQLPQKPLPYTVEGVVFMDSPKVNIKALLGVVQLREVVVATGNKPWLVKGWKEQARKLGMELYEVKEKGAYTFLTN